MSANISSNISLQPALHCYSDSTHYPQVFTCFERNTVGAAIFIAYSVANVLVLPLYFLVLWMGFRRWRRERSAAWETTSHSDVFTYNMVTMEIIMVLGFVFYCSAIFVCSPWLIITGYYVMAAVFPVQTVFHCLTCVERYLAVVHPIAYLSLGKSGRVRVRNISVGCVWLLDIGLTGVVVFYFPEFPPVIFFSLNILVIGVVTFCSISVPIRLGLRKVGGRREQVDQTKRRAFYSILVITGTLVMRSSGLLVTTTISSFESGNQRDRCVALMCGSWLCLPSSLVLPLLFLHRAGALTRFSRDTNKGER